MSYVERREIVVEEREDDEDVVVDCVTSIKLK